MSVSLQNLWEDYAAYSDKPVCGGRYALLGFGYQLSVSLNRFFDLVLAGNTDAQIAFEGLSDFTEWRDDFICFCEVKTMLDSGSLKDAAREFLNADKFLEENYPALQNKSRFQIYYRESPRISPYDPANLKLKFDASDAARWEAVRSRVLPFQCQADPYIDLVIKLFRQTPKAQEFVDSVIGILLRFLGEGRTSTEISLELLSRWESATTQEPAPGDLLGPTDFADCSENQSYVLVGQRPTLADLNAGCFMARRELVQQITAALRAARIREQGRDREKVPVVWIDGGSGVGKSALLLQTIRELALTESDPINYLGHYANQLPKSLRYWGAQSMPTVIAIDDIYAPDYRQADLWSEVNHLAHDAPYTTILTCGPSDYREHFEKMAGRYGALRVIRVDVPQLEDAERELYRTWYCLRTDQPDTKPITEKNFVVAAFILELSHKGDTDLGDFAVRLEQRLAELQIREEFLVALSINRLGLEAPMTLLERKLDAIGRLVSEGLCQLGKVPELEESTLWFHGELASAIYDILIPEEHNVNARSEHIIQALAACLNNQARAVSLIQLVGNSKQKRIPENLVNLALRGMWRVFEQQNPPDLPLAAMFAWRDAVNNKGLAAGKIMNPNCLREWMTSPLVNAQGWALLFQLIWQCDIDCERDNLTAQAEVWLNEHPELPEWNFVWRLLWEHRKGDSSLLQLAKRWIETNLNDPGWSYVFQKLHGDGVCDNWMQELGLIWLKTSPTTPSDGYMFTRIKSLQPPADVLIRVFTQRLCRERIPFFRNAGIKLLLSDISTEGWKAIINGLLLGMNEDCWSHVWRALVASPTCDDQLLQQGREWLPGREDKPEWNYVWQRLVDSPACDAQLLQQGQDWLHGRENKPEYPFVLRELRRH